MELSQQLGALTASLGQEKALQSRSAIASSTIDVSLKFATGADSLIVRNNQFQISYSDNSVRAQLSNAISYLLKPSGEKSNKTQETAIQRQLVALGKPHDLPIPESISKLLKINNVSQRQLLALASQPNGYPLGEGKLTGKQLLLNQETAINLDGPKLKEVNYRANLVQNQGRLSLRLSPILVKTLVNLTPSGPVSAQDISSTSPQASNQIQTRVETATLFRETIKHLSQTQTEKQATQASEVTAQGKKGLEIAKTLSQSVASLQPIKLAEAFDPAKITQTNREMSRVNPQLQTPKDQASSTPASQPTVQSTKQLKEITASLASSLTPKAQPIQDESLAKEQNQRPTPVNSASLLAQLTTKLPSFLPHSLEDLAQPHTLKNELVSSSYLNLAQAASPIAAQTNAGALSTLFVLLLGVRANASGAQISKQLLEQIQKLQQSYQLDPALLSRLHKANLLETSAQIASGFQLYQQASTQDQQGINWYFSLPYQLNDKQEQFEGRFEQGENDKDEQSKEWRLQLKFNLTQGSMLVMAHKHSDELALTFKSESDELLKKINQYINPLNQKLNALGFSIDDIKTQYQIVPATLLPGDYYLVQAKA